MYNYTRSTAWTTTHLLYIYIYTFSLSLALSISLLISLCLSLSLIHTYAVLRGRCFRSR